MKNIAAFYDIDGTLYRESLTIDVFKKFVTYELIDMEVWLNDVKPSFTKYDRRQGEYDDYLGKMLNIFTHRLVGLSNEHINHIAEQVIKQKGDRVYRFTRDEILRHKKENHLVFAISGSPIELVQKMADKYEFTDFRGTIYKVDDDFKYTGEIVPMWDHKSKLKAIQDIVKAYDIDLSESYAYGDTTGDFTMFELVGHPYAINPTKELIDKIIATPEVAKKIKIIVERKNVIYEIDVNQLKVR